MNFTNRDDLGIYFKKAIERESSLEITELKNEINSMTKDAKDLFEKELEEEKIDMLASRARDIYKQHQEELSVKQRNLDLLVMKKRMELIDELFNNLALEIEKFRDTPVYAKWFNKKLSTYQVKDFDAIEVNEKDLSLVPKTLKAIINPKIKAGFILHSKHLSAIVTETISSNLEDARKHFYSTAKWFSE